MRAFGRFGPGRQPKRSPRGGKDNREGEEYHAEKKNSLNYIIKNQPLDRAVWFWFGLVWVGFGWCLSVPVWSCRLVLGWLRLGWGCAFIVQSFWLRRVLTRAVETGLAQQQDRLLLGRFFDPPHPDVQTQPIDEPRDGF